MRHFPRILTSCSLLLLGYAAPVNGAEPTPQFYGVYAVDRGNLVELAPSSGGALPFTPADTGVVHEPAKVRLPDGRLSFIVYLRDVATSAPDVVWINIVARIVRGKDVDANNNVRQITPMSNLWKIRDRGYKFRVEPRPGNHEIIVIRAEAPNFTLPSGRYAFSIFGKTYDFVAGNDDGSNPEDCVERISKIQNQFFPPQVSYDECPRAAVANTAPVSQSWKTYEYPDSRFSVSSPSALQVQVLHYTAFGGHIDNSWYTASLSSGYAVSLNVFDWPNTTDSPSAILDQLARSAAKTIVQGVIVGRTGISLNGNPGIELSINGQTTQVRERDYIIGRRVYEISTSNTTSVAPWPDADRFFASFRVTAP